jgi:predicted enzyme related to lactoylglutathione lyase
MPKRGDDPTTPATAGLLVNIDVDELDRAVAFYAAALGLRPARRFGELGVEMLGAPCAIYLLAKPAGSTPAVTTPQQRRDYRRHWTPVHLDFVVPDVAAAVRRAEAAGARLEEEIRTHEWGRLAVMADPFGHGFCLIEFIGPGYDAIATGRG